MRIMKKFLCLLLTVLLLFSLSVPSLAAQITDMDITVTVNDDGSAVVSQVWKTAADNGTEFYMPFSTNGYLTLTDLSVRDTERVYETEDGWDTDRSFEEKAYRCGLLPTDSGYEICFGISRYGENTYTVTYTVHHMFNAYEDTDGTLFRFVNDKLNVTPTNVRLSMRLADGTPVTHDACGIWAFGYDGDIRFENGGIVAATASPIEEENHMTLMVELQKGVLHPDRTADGTFAAVKRRAFEDSDYGYDDGDDDGAGIIAVLCLLLFVVVLLTALTVSIVNRLRLKHFAKKFGYWRDPPCDNDLAAAAHLATLFRLCKEETFIGALMLRMVVDGELAVEKTVSVGAMGGEKTKKALRLVKEPQDDMFKQKLFSVLQHAAGSDGVLSEKELKTYCSKHEKPLRGLLDAAASEGHRYFTERHCFKKTDLHTKNEPRTLGGLTAEGRQKLGEVTGYRQYLRDFSLIAEREISEAPVWQEMLVYAMLFGVAGTVIEQLKKLCPAQLPAIEQYDSDLPFVIGCYHGMYASMRTRENEIATRNSGGGGSASFGGGGGFSGGGSGGGVR